MAAFDARKANIQRCVSSRDNSGALRAACKAPPLNSDDENLKNKNWLAVRDALAGFKSSEIPKAVGTLSDEECDTLMKYIYRGMAETSEESDDSSIYLAFHAALFEKHGHGVIMRTVADRRTV